MNKGNKIQERLYTKADLDKTFIMGLESAVVVLETSVQLSRSDLLRLIESLKEMII